MAFIFILLLALLVTPCASASQSPIRMVWQCSDPLARYFRYQLNGEDEDKWTIVERGSASISLPSRDGTNTVYVQSSRDGITWSKSGTGTYERIPSKAWDTSVRLNLGPYSSAVYWFYNGHHIDEARTLMGTVYGLSVGVELDCCPIESLRLYPEIGYSMVLKVQTIIPKKRAVQYAKLGVGADWLFPITDKTDVYAGLLGGGMVHMNNSKYTITPYFGIRMGVETDIAENVRLGAMMRVSGAFLKTDESLTDSLTLLVDPISVSLSYGL